MLFAINLFKERTGEKENGAVIDKRRGGFLLFVFDATGDQGCVGGLSCGGDQFGGGSIVREVTRERSFRPNDEVGFCSGGEFRQIRKRVIGGENLLIVAFKDTSGIWVDEGDLEVGGRREGRGEVDTFHGIDPLPPRDGQENKGYKEGGGRLGKVLGKRRRFLGKEKAWGGVSIVETEKEGGDSGVDGENDGGQCVGAEERGTRKEREVLDLRGGERIPREAGKEGRDEVFGADPEEGFKERKDGEEKTRGRKFLEKRMGGGGCEGEETGKEGAIGGEAEKSEKNERKGTTVVREGGEPRKIQNSKKKAENPTQEESASGGRETQDNQQWDKSEESDVVLIGGRVSERQKDGGYESRH